MSFDDQYLFTVGEDSSLFIYKATDKEGRGLKRDKELVYAEEILITKSDLEEKVRAYVVLLNYIVNTWICHTCMRGDTTGFTIGLAMTLLNT